MHIQMAIAFILYFSILFLIALASKFKERVSARKDVSGFMLGGRSINFWMTAISAHASDMSNWLFMAYPAMIFTQGLSAVWVAIGLTTYMFLNWHFIAPKIRIETEKYKTPTLSSYFSVRFNDKGSRLRVVGAVLASIFFSIYIAAGLKGIGLIFESVFNFNYSIGILVAIAVVILYTVMGGFVAVAWIDFFQGMFLLSMVILVPLVAFTHIDGFSAIKQAALSKNLSLALFSDYSLKTICGSIFVAFGWGLGYFGMPHIITKFMGIDNPSDINKSKYLGTLWQVLSLGAATFVGLIGLAYFKTGPVNTEMIFVEMVKDFFSPFWSGFILCAIFAAIISTLDSQVLVLTSTVTEDFYKCLFRPEAGERELQWVYRIGIVLMCLVSALIALDKTQTITSFVEFAWNGIGSTFGPLVILGLYSKSVNRHGALAGMLIGGTLALLWNPCLSHMMSFKIHAMIPGFFGNFLGSLVVSRLTK